MAKEKPRLWDRDPPSPRRIYAQLDEYVIGQERAKRALSIAAYNHFKRLRNLELGLAGEGPPLRKSNLLLVGPSGCGKTHLARRLSKILDVPFAVVDATEYTEAGYYGKDVEVMLGELLYASDLDPEVAQRGIVFIDEVDKIARRNQGARTGAGSRDIGGEGVQQGLLKLIEGTTCFVPYNITQHWSKHDFVQMNTTEILFICAGTFTDMQRGKHGRRAGFRSDEPAPDGSIPFADRVTVEDLLEYGLIAEFLGRIPIIIELHELEEEHLVRILTEPPDALASEYRRLLAMDGVELELSAEALREIAYFAKRRKLGARSLRAIVEDVMSDYMFEAPEKSGTRLVIGRDEVLKKLR